MAQAQRRADGQTGRGGQAGDDGARRRWLAGAGLRIRRARVRSPLGRSAAVRRSHEVVRLPEAFVREAAEGVESFRRLGPARGGRKLVSAAHAQRADGGQAARVRRPFAGGRRGQCDCGVEPGQGADQECGGPRVEPEADADGHALGGLGARCGGTGWGRCLARGRRGCRSDRRRLACFELSRLAREAVARGRGHADEGFAEPGRDGRSHGAFDQRGGP